MYNLGDLWVHKTLPGDFWTIVKVYKSGRFDIRHKHTDYIATKIDEGIMKGASYTHMPHYIPTEKDYEEMV